MFDTFDILVPEIVTSCIELRQHETAFGPEEDKFAYIRGVEFARVLVARNAYTAMRGWTGSEDRESWMVLVAHEQANEAAASDDAWANFLDLLVTVLRAHEFWRVRCESDCDQHPIEKLILSPEDLSLLLNSLRSSGARRIAFRGTSHADPCDNA